MVEAMFAATGSSEIQPDHVKASADICSRQMITHISVRCANFHLLPRQTERKVLMR